MNIGLLSDTHGFLDENIFHYFKDCDEVWHAGDFGDLEVANRLENFKPFKGVFGNIDYNQIQIKYPEHQKFEMEGLKIWMTHIGGYPPRYHPKIKDQITTERPDLFICGHSHILKVMPDKTLPGLLHINPGAAGHHGMHLMRTVIRFKIKEGRVQDLEVIELGKRGRLET